MKSWTEKKNYLCGLIKETSDFYGGDEIGFLREYCREIIIKYKNDLDEPIACFEDLKRYCKK